MAEKHKCSKCGREFARPQNLKMHATTCKGEVLQQPKKESIEKKPIEEKPQENEQKKEDSDQEEKPFWDI